jgi:CRP/FNR family cyclic AMP-dependent transcriptional regulator
MKERFENKNRPHLVAALTRQEVSLGSTEIVEALLAHGSLVELAPGEKLIVQDSHDNDIYLLVAGVVGIIINGAHVATRRAGQHVGEVSAIEPSLPRSATVSVLERVVALRVSSAGLMKVGEKFPRLFLPIAQELARRLYQRNSTIFVPNTTPKLFIISSSEAKPIAYSVRDALKRDVLCKIWDDGVFFAGGYPLEALEREVAASDFALAIAEADDISISRRRKAPTVRDNVLFELGLFMGTLTRYRAILAHPKIKNLKLPSDFQGLTAIQYEPGNGATLDARVAPMCDKIRILVKERGVRTFTFG